MIRLIGFGLHFTALASYGICTTLALLGLLTILLGLFKGDTNAQVGGFGVLVTALTIATITATIMHFHRKATR